MRQHLLVGSGHCQKLTHNMSKLGKPSFTRQLLGNFIALGE